MVESHWKATTTFRLNDNQKNRNIALSEIFEKWSILTHPKGYSLIVLDFQHLELGATEDAISQWLQFFQNVLKICPLDKKNILRVQELLQIIESNQNDGMFIYSIVCNYFYMVIKILENIISITFLEIESKAIAQLCALFYMISPKGRVKTKKGHWKPSMRECEENLVVHVKV